MKTELLTKFQEQFSNKIDEMMKDIDKRFEDKKKKMDKHLDDLRQELREKHRCRSKALFGQQARPDHEDVYGEGYGEPKDDGSTEGGEIGDTPSENQPQQLQPTTSNLTQQPETGQEEHSAPVRHIESDHGDVCPDDESILAVSPHGEGLDGEPVPQNAGINCAEKPAMQQEAIPTSPNISKQERSTAAVNFIVTTREFWAIQQTLLRQNNTINKLDERSKFVDSDGSQDFYALPSLPITSGKV